MVLLFPFPAVVYLGFVGVHDRVVAGRDGSMYEA